MPEASTLALFAAAAAALVVLPGPNSLYIAARSLRDGLAAGVVSSLGIMLGTIVHIGAAALGVSALVLSSALSLRALQYAGAAYLAYLGLRALRAASPGPAEAAPASGSCLRRIFWQGVLVNVLNPKTALFFAAFLPQFLDPRRGSIPAQIGVLGAILIALGAASDLAYALLAGQVGRRLRGSLRARRGLRYLAAGVYLALGLAAAWGGARR